MRLRDDRGFSGRGDPATNQRVWGFHLWEAEKEVAFRWDSKKIKFVGRRKDRVTFKIKEGAVWSSGISLPWAGLCHLLYLSSYLDCWGHQPTLLTSFLIHFPHIGQVPLSFTTVKYVQCNIYQLKHLKGHNSAVLNTLTMFCNNPCLSRYFIP